MHKTFDVIIVGGGHAGTEAALAAARVGVQTLLITHRSDTLGEMSCNPSIGGIGKSQLVKEIDALGGIMAHAADQAGIQFRVLNASKGAAVRSTRAQIDRALYRQAIRFALENQPNLFIFQDAVDDLIIDHDAVRGVITKTGLTFNSKTVVLTAGTFLNGKIHIGDVNYTAGRMGDPSSILLAQKLRELPLRVGRLKTGTPARLDSRTIDYSKLQIQRGDTPTPVFSFLGKASDHPPQINCHIAQTNEITHEIIRAAFDQSPLFSGKIEGIGPRYCPSIEDKVNRFADKTSHQIFVEPEGLLVTEVYPNGISTSLPFAVQRDFIHSIVGFENVHIMRFGYAIEYDFFDPRDLKSSLETKAIAGLFFAGQINGTTGYEEAAAQGLIAGINAARLAREQTAWTPHRSEAYIGVLIDDLITRGTKEPYRMFTSRAEYRLLLREDNADLRLTEKGRELGLIADHRWEVLVTKRELIAQEQGRLKSTWIKPNTEASARFTQVFGKELTREYNLMELLKRPEVDYLALMNIVGTGFKPVRIPDDFTRIGLKPVPTTEIGKEISEQIEIQAKYAGYIERQQTEIERLTRYENLRIPPDFDYQKIISLSVEIRQKLIAAKPETVGMAARISGVTPAAISLLLVYLKKS